MVANGSINMGPEMGQRRAEVATIVPRVAESIRRADEKIVTLVQERPITTLCVAAAVGYLIGRIVTRFG